MPDLHLYTTDADDLRKATLAFDHGCSMIPDLHYDSREYVSLTTVSEYLSYRQRTRAFYLVADNYFRCPLEIHEIQKNEKTVYYIDPHSGGPTIQFSAGGVFEENGSTFIRSGDVGYYPTYWNTLRSKSETPPPELIATYKSLVKQIKKMAVRVTVGQHNQVFWLGEGAQEAVGKGAKLVGFEKYDVAKLIHSDVG